jgi:hypothetical protein
LLVFCKTLHYRIEGIDISQSPATATFVDPDSPGASTSVANYMKKKYGVTIKNDRAPLLIAKTGTKKGTTPTWIAPELCV